MKADIDSDGYLRIDAQSLVQSFPDAVLRDVAKYALFNDLLLDGIVGALVDGHMWGDGEEPWWFGSETFTKLRLRLLPLLPEITAEAVRHLERDARKERTERVRWHDAAWKLWHAWPDKATRPEHPSWAYEHQETMTKEQAEAHLRKVEALPRMSRNEAREIARRAAKAKPQSYYAEPFEPHEWVIDAIVDAAGTVEERREIDRLRALAVEACDIAERHVFTPPPLSVQPGERVESVTWSQSVTVDWTKLYRDKDRLAEIRRGIGEGT